MATNIPNNPLTTKDITNKMTKPFQAHLLFLNKKEENTINRIAKIGEKTSPQILIILKMMEKENIIIRI